MLACQKHRFHLPEDQHYLNCAYMSPLSTEVEEAGIRGLLRKRNPGAITRDMFFEESDRLRALFARLVHAPDPKQVALIPSVSYGMATVARNLPLEPGNRVVIAHEQFPSDVYVWRRACAETGADLHTVAPPEGDGNRGREWNRRLLEAVDDRTAAVVLGHVHWADGTRFDLDALGRRAREVGAALIVDGTQSVGALPFDVARTRPDALICAGYKWLFGPYSTGVAYYGPRFAGGLPLEENWITRRQSELFSRLVDYKDGYQPGMIRYDVGERSNFALLPMLIRAIEQLLEWTVEGIETYCRTLTAPLFDALADTGLSVEDPAWRGAHMFGIRLPAHLDVNEVRESLRARSISVSVRGSAIRVSPNVYNDARDVEALHDALESSLHPTGSRTTPT